MKQETAAWLSSFALGIAAFVSTFAAEPTPPAGFRALFNGKDLAGWHGLNPHTVAKLDGDKREAALQKMRDEFSTFWKIENGELVNDGHGPYATTDEEFGDIEFLIEYKTVAGADSGIYLRGTPQVQIWDIHQPSVAQAPDRNPNRGSGGLFNNLPRTPGRDPLVVADKAFGEWNSFRIRQIGARTWVWLNQQLVVDDAVMQNYWDRSQPLPAKGPIMLQTHGGEIRWRNLFVRDIAAKEAAKILSDAGTKAKNTLADKVLIELGRADEPTDPRRPAAIDTEDVPVIPQEVFDRLRQYSHIRQAEFAGWSSDGKGMLIGTRFGNSVQLHRVHEPGGRREQLTFFDEPVEGRPVPRATDGAILLSMSQGGDENFQSYLLVPKAFAITRLTDGKSRNEPGPVRDDGSQFVVHSNRRNGRDMDILIGDVRRPDSLRTVLETKGEYWRARDWSPDGSQLLVSRYVSINESYPAILDVASGKLTPLPLPAKGKAAIGDMAFTADGAAALLTCDAQSEFLQLFRLDLETLEYQQVVTDLEWDIDSGEVEPHTGRVAFTTNEDGASGLFVLEGDKPKRLNVPLGVIRGIEFSPDGKQLGFSLSRPDSPGDAYSVDLATGKLTRWTFSETGGLAPERFVRPDRIQFSSFDGQIVSAWCFRCPGANPQEPAPVLVMIHGGPESQSRPTFIASIQYYVNVLGLAVVVPNVRGSSGYGKTFLQLDNGPQREDSVKDIGALLDWVGTQNDLDKSRVAVSGGSYGGYMVLASLVHFGDRLRAGIDNVGIADWITFLKNTSPYRQDLRRAEYGDERDPAMRSVFERISPLANADRIRSALLVAHGRNDPRVPFSEAEQIAKRVRGANKPVWTVYADNEGHGFAKKDNRDYLAAVESVFLLKNLIEPAK